MDDLKELAQRLDFAADTSDMGRDPDYSSVTRRSSKALREAAARITELERQLAAREAEIVAWLREQTSVAFAKPAPDDWPLDAWNARQLGIHSALHDAANALAPHANKGDGA